MADPKAWNPQIKINRDQRAKKAAGRPVRPLEDPDLLTSSPLALFSRLFLGGHSVVLVPGEKGRF